MRILKRGMSPDSVSRNRAEAGGSGDTCVTAELNHQAVAVNALDGPGFAVISMSGETCEFAPKQKRESIVHNDNTADGNSISSAKKEFDRLLSQGLRLLSMREHSTQEIVKKLSAKCEAPDIVHAVVDQLVNNNYLSDERFTESYVRFRQNRGFGPSKIRAELLSKGININMIDDYLKVNSSIWYENAETLYKKKYGSEAVTDYNGWAKRARFLQSRGFSMEHIQVTLPAIDYD